ncbi:FAD-containing oxidoreductase [Mesorhizobium sp. LHD-90]|uniref:FAD-containing oxidoreductase n=1 Tax=Mesorhizobium sp. LHD-90 TaxID=3071414 RepID=UPI0027E1D6EF|nr:FAD-containing oxidoreductase [Mesorhizobium sp. LHD-90]MDQ6433978.1 FAD-containing oxidoreductase [Mesorhizobium sp. LHD-90]
MTRIFDAIVIGGGQAGPSLAVRLANAGNRVAMIERKFLGGTCVNTGCKPTKTMVASAYAAQMARRGGDYGVVLGDIGVDMDRVKARKDKVTLDSRNGLRTWLDGTKNVNFIDGHARFRAPREIEVNGEVLSAEKIFLNVGGRASVPDLPGVHDIPYLTNSSMMELDTLPRHLVVIGGSYIGLEFAQMFRRFGSEVTVVEKGPRLTGREDEDVSRTIHDILAKEGIAFRLNAECISFRRHGGDIAVGVDCTQGDPEILGSHVFLAMGRRPNTDDLGLEKAGIESDERGYIKVDDQLRTTAENVWAMGDCNGRGAFTHTAYNDFEIVAANLLDGDSRRLSDRFPCYALYIDPPLGRVGMTEAEARKSGKNCLIGRLPMTRVGRAVERGETEGFMKVLVDADSRQILGASILGASGDEVVHGILDLMYAKAKVDTLVRSVPIHPTVSELLPTVFGSLKPLQ